MVLAATSRIPVAQVMLRFEALQREVVAAAAAAGPTQALFRLSSSTLTDTYCASPVLRDSTSLNRCGECFSDASFSSDASAAMGYEYDLMGGGAMDSEYETTIRLILDATEAHSRTTSASDLRLEKLVTIQRPLAARMGAVAQQVKHQGEEPIPEKEHNAELEAYALAFFDGICASSGGAEETGA